MQVQKRLMLSLALSIPVGCEPAGGGAPVDGDNGDENGENDDSGGTDDSGADEADDGVTDDGDDEDGGTGTDTDEECPGEIEVECSLNEDCEDTTGYCRSFSNAPPDPEASCEEPGPDQEIEILGTLRSFTSFRAVAGLEVRVAGALPTLSNPQEVTPIAMATSGSDGRIETTSDMADGEAVGIVAIAGDTDQYYLTASGLVEADLSVGSYPPGVDNHDLWVVPRTLLEEWSDLLADDPQVAPHVPLGQRGGVVGHVRDPHCGEGVAGIEVVPRIPEVSQAIIRYLDEDGQGFNSDATSSNGYFVIVNPSLAEKFDGLRDGEVVHKREATVGSTAGGIFAVTIILEPDAL